MKIISERTITKSITVLVLMCFTYSFILYEPLLGAMERIKDIKQSKEIENKVEDEFILSSYGSITRRDVFGSDRLIVFIQDLHNNPEVQKNIFHMIETLDNKTTINRIFVEGAPAGKVDSSLLQVLTDQKAREASLKSLFDKGLLGGAEYYALLHDPDKLYGIEDWAVYEDNLKRLARLFKNKDQNAKTATSLDGFIEQLKNRYLSGDMRRTEKILNKNRRNINRASYYSFIENAAKKADIDLGQYPQLSLQLEIVKTHKNINERKLKKELQEYISDLKVTLPYSLYKAIIEKVSAGDHDSFYAYLYEIAQKQSNALEAKYPQLAAFLEYSRLKNRLNPIHLLTEENVFEETFLSKKAHTLVEQEILFLSSMNRVFANIVTLKGSTQDYDHYSKNASLFEALLQKYSFATGYNPQGILDLLKDRNLSDYYSVNLARNALFLKNIILEGSSSNLYHQDDSSAHAQVRSIKQYGNIDIVIVGGFHGDLASLLKQNNFSYVCITPRVTKKHEGDLYEKVITGNLSIRELAGSSLKTPFIQEIAQVIINNLLQNKSYAEIQLALKEDSRFKGFDVQISGDAYLITYQGLPVVTLDNQYMHQGPDYKKERQANDVGAIVPVLKRIGLKIIHTIAPHHSYAERSDLYDYLFGPLFENLVSLIIAAPVAGLLFLVTGNADIALRAAYAVTWLIFVQLHYKRFGREKASTLNRYLALLVAFINVSLTFVPLLTVSEMMMLSVLTHAGVNTIARLVIEAGKYVKRKIDPDDIILRSRLQNLKAIIRNIFFDDRVVEEALAPVVKKPEESVVNQEKHVTISNISSLNTLLMAISSLVLPGLFTGFAVMVPFYLKTGYILPTVFLIVALLGGFTGIPGYRYFMLQRSKIVDTPRKAIPLTRELDAEGSVGKSMMRYELVEYFPELEPILLRFKGDFRSITSRNLLDTLVESKKVNNQTILFINVDLMRYLAPGARKILVNAIISGELEKIRVMNDEVAANTPARLVTAEVDDIRYRREATFYDVNISLLSNFSPEEQSRYLNHVLAYARIERYVHSKGMAPFLARVSLMMVRIVFLGNNPKEVVILLNEYYRYNLKKVFSWNNIKDIIRHRLNGTSIAIGLIILSFFIFNFVWAGQFGVFTDENYFTIARNWGNIPILISDAALWPQLSNFAAVIGGILGSRVLTLLLNTTTLFVSTKLIKYFQGKIGVKDNHNLFYIFGVFIFSFSAQMLFTSTFAVHDVLSITFFVLAFWQLVEGVEKEKKSSLYLASIFTLLIFVSRYSYAIYVPVLAAYAFYSSIAKKNFKLVLWHYFFPVAFLFVGYGVFRYQHIAEAFHAASAGTSDYVLSVPYLAGLLFKRLFPFVVLNIFLVRDIAKAVKEKNYRRLFDILFVMSAALLMVVFTIFIMKGNYGIQKHFVITTFFLTILTTLSASNLFNAVYGFIKRVSLKLKVQTISLALIMVLFFSQGFSMATADRQYLLGDPRIPPTNYAQYIAAHKDEIRQSGRGVAYVGNPDQNRANFWEGAYYLLSEGNIYDVFYYYDSENSWYFSSIAGNGEEDYYHALSVAAERQQGFISLPMPAGLVLGQTVGVDNEYTIGAVDPINDSVSRYTLRLNEMDHSVSESPALLPEERTFFTDTMVFRHTEEWNIDNKVQTIDYDDYLVLQSGTEIRIRLKAKNSEKPKLIRIEFLQDGEDEKMPLVYVREGDMEYDPQTGTFSIPLDFNTDTIRVKRIAVFLDDDSSISSFTYMQPKKSVLQLFLRYGIPVIVFFTYAAYFFRKLYKTYLKKSRLDDDAVEEEIAESRQFGETIVVELDQIRSDEDIEQLFQGSPVHIAERFTRTLRASQKHKRIAQKSIAHRLKDESQRSLLRDYIKMLYHASQNSHQATLAKRKIGIVWDKALIGRSDLFVYPSMQDATIYVPINLIEEVKSESERETLKEILEFADRSLIEGYPVNDLMPEQKAAIDALRARVSIHSESLKDILFKAAILAASVALFMLFFWFTWYTGAWNFANKPIYIISLALVQTILSVTLLIKIFISFLFYKPFPSRNYYPTVSVVIPAYNEEDAISACIENIVRNGYPPDKMEIVVVNDGSQDNTLEKMNAMAQKYPGLVKVYDQGVNQGTLKAMTRGMEESTGEVIVFVDSDSFAEKDSIYQLVQPLADQKIGAVSGQVKASNVGQNILTKMQDIWYFSMFREKTVESVFGMVTCAPGCLSAYRRSEVEKVLERFKKSKTIIAVDRTLTNLMLELGLKVVYQSTATGTTIVPDNMPQLIQQQLRWQRSWVYESLVVANRFIWKRNPIGAFFFYQSILLTYLTPLLTAFVGIYSLFMWNMPLWNFVFGLAVLPLIYSLYHLFSERKDYSLQYPLFAYIQFFIINPLIYYSTITTFKNIWGTRDKKKPQKKPLFKVFGDALKAIYADISHAFVSDVMRLKKAMIIVQLLLILMPPIASAYNLVRFNRGEIYPITYSEIAGWKLSPGWFSAATDMGVLPEKQFALSAFGPGVALSNVMAVEWEESYVFQATEDIVEYEKGETRFFIDEGYMENGVFLVVNRRLMAVAANDDLYNIVEGYRIVDPIVTHVRVMIETNEGAEMKAFIDEVRFSKVVEREKPTIVLRFDDAPANQLQAAELMEQYGFRGVFNVPTDGPEVMVPYGSMSWDEVRWLQSHGHQIGSHSVSHADLTNLSEEQLAAEIDGSLKKFATQGVQVTTFAAPYASQDSDILREVERTYTSYQAGDTSVDSLNHNPYLITTIFVDGAAPSNVKGIIDNAIRNNSTIVLTFHQFSDTPQYDYENTYKNFEEILRYLREKQVEVMTIDEVLQEEDDHMQNLMENTSFQTSNVPPMEEAIVSKNDVPVEKSAPQQEAGDLMDDVTPGMPQEPEQALLPLSSLTMPLSEKTLDAQLKVRYPVMRTGSGYFVDESIEAQLFLPPTVDMELFGRNFYVVDEKGNIVFTGDLGEGFNTDSDWTAQNQMFAPSNLTLNSIIYRLKVPGLHEEGEYKVFVEYNKSLFASQSFHVSKNEFESLPAGIMQTFYQRRHTFFTVPDQCTVFGDVDSTTLDGHAVERVPCPKGYFHEGNFISITRVHYTAFNELSNWYMYGKDIYDASQFPPEVADEYEYALRFALGLQRPNGGVYSRMGPAILSDVEASLDNQYMTWFLIGGYSTPDTAGMVKMYADGSVFFRDKDPELSRQLAEAAFLGWQYLQDHPETKDWTPVRGVVRGGYHEEDDDLDKRVAAAIALLQLYDLTSHRDEDISNTQLNAFINDNISQLQISQAQTYNATSLVFQGMLFSPSTQHLRDAQVTARQGWDKYVEELMWVYDNDPLHLATGFNRYVWDSNAIITEDAAHLLLTYKLTGNTRFYDAAMWQFRYLSGFNPTGRSQIVGFGPMPPKEANMHDVVSKYIPDDIYGNYILGGAGWSFSDKIPGVQELWIMDSNNNFVGNEVGLGKQAMIYILADGVNEYHTKIENDKIEAASAAEAEKKAQAEAAKKAAEAEQAAQEAAALKAAEHKEATLMPAQVLAPTQSIAPKTGRLTLDIVLEFFRERLNPIRIALNYVILFITLFAPLAVLAKMRFNTLRKNGIEKELSKTVAKMIDILLISPGTEGEMKRLLKERHNMGIGTLAIAPLPVRMSRKDLKEARLNVPFRDQQLLIDVFIDIESGVLFYRLPSSIEIDKDMLNVIVNLGIQVAYDLNNKGILYTLLSDTDYARRVWAVEYPSDILSVYHEASQTFPSLEEVVQRPWNEKGYEEKRYDSLKPNRKKNALYSFYVSSRQHLLATIGAYYVKKITLEKKQGTITQVGLKFSLKELNTADIMRFARQYPAVSSFIIEGIQSKNPEKIAKLKGKLKEIGIRLITVIPRNQLLEKQRVETMRNIIGSLKSSSVQIDIRHYRDPVVFLELLEKGVIEAKMRGVVPYDHSVTVIALPRFDLPQYRLLDVVLAAESTIDIQKAIDEDAAIMLPITDDVTWMSGMFQSAMHAKQLILDTANLTDNGPGLLGLRHIGQDGSLGLVQVMNMLWGLLPTSDVLSVSQQKEMSQRECWEMGNALTTEGSLQPQDILSLVQYLLDLKNKMVKIEGSLQQAKVFEPDVIEDAKKKDLITSLEALIQLTRESSINEKAKIMIITRISDTMLRITETNELRSIYGAMQGLSSGVGAFTSAFLFALVKDEAMTEIGLLSSEKIELLVQSTQGLIEKDRATEINKDFVGIKSRILGHIRSKGMVVEQELEWTIALELIMHMLYVNGRSLDKLETVERIAETGAHEAFKSILAAG